MKKQKTQSKIIIAMSAVILLLVALSATLTFAWFTAQVNNTEKSMQFGKLTLNATDGFGITKCEEHELDNIIPGCEMKLNGSVTINTTINAFVRTKFEVLVLRNGADSSKVALTEMPQGGVEGTATTEYRKFNGKYYLNSEVESYACAPAAVGAINPTHAQTVYAKIFDLFKADLSEQQGAADQAYAWLNHTDGYSYLNQAVKATGNDGLNIINFGANDKIQFVAGETGNDWQGQKILVVFGVESIQAGHLDLVNDSDENDTNDVTETGLITANNVATLAGSEVWNVNLVSGLSD